MWKSEGMGGLAKLLQPRVLLYISLCVCRVHKTGGITGRGSVLFGTKREKKGINLAKVALVFDERSRL